MSLKILALYFTHHTLHFVTLILCAPTFDVEVANISNRKVNAKEKFVSRILSGSNITHSELRSTFGQYADTSLYSQDIIFPDAFQLLIHRSLGLEATPRCVTKGSQFCEEFEAYPYRHLRHILRTNKHSEYFGIDDEPIEIINRLGEPEETEFCSSTFKTIFPKVGKNKDDKWKFIINQGDEEGVHVQGIRVETCINLNGPCNLLSDMPIGYSTFCKQKFVLRRLLSVSENGQPVPDTFQIPSSCCCSYKKDLSSLVKSGRDNVPPNKERQRSSL